MIDIDVLSTAAGLKEFDAATVAAYCHTDEHRVVLVLDEHGDLFAKRIPRHQAQPGSPRYRVLHPDALARRISTFASTPDFAPSPLFDQVAPRPEPEPQAEPQPVRPEPPREAEPVRSRPRAPRGGPRPRRPERGDQPAPKFTSGGYTSAGYTTSGAAKPRTPLSQKPSPTGTPRRATPSSINPPANQPRKPAPWNRPPAPAAQQPTQPQPAPKAVPEAVSEAGSDAMPARRLHRRTAPTRPPLPQLGAPSVPNSTSSRARSHPDVQVESTPSGHAGLDRLEVIHTRDPEPDPRLAHAEGTLLACAREADPRARHTLASAAMSTLSECVPNLPRDGELHTAELPARLRFALTLATLTLIESTGQPIARKLLISAYDDAAALAQEFLPPRQADLISRFRALAAGRPKDSPLT